MATPLRLAVIGTGHMAATMIAAMRHVDGVTPSAIVSRDAARARAFADAHGVASAYGDVAAALADPDVDAVYIAGESAGHAAAALAALEAGKPVLCEKPLAVSATEAARLTETAARTGTLLMEAVATPFLPAVRAALDAARSGGLGELRQFSASFGYPTSPESHPGCWQPAGGGVLLDRMVYPVMLARLAMGPITSVEAAVACDSNGIDVDATLMLRHEGGATSLLGASLVTLLANSMTIAGTRGTATVAEPLLAAEQVAITHHGPPTRGQPPGGGWRHALARQPLLRRARHAAKALAARHIGYGASPYVAELTHFRNLYRQGAKASAVLPPELSLEVARILDDARTQGR